VAHQRYIVDPKMWCSSISRFNRLSASNIYGFNRRLTVSNLYKPTETYIHTRCRY
jgi:hypothetical protein